jgi:hypothetical protein
VYCAAADADAARPMPALGESAMKAQKTTLIKTVVAGLSLLALTFGIPLSSAKAQDKPDYSSTGGVAPVFAAANPNSAAKAKNYFVEFRSRSALSYGHTLLVHGKLNAQGQVGKVSRGQVAGLHPATDSSIPWMIGHIIPVVSERGWSDGDDEDEYVTAAYRVTLTESEYARVSAFIRKHQKDSPMWHAVLYNCNAWVGDVAKFMGLKAPDNTLAYPEEYISTLARLNGGKVTRPNPAPQRSGKPATAGAPKPAKPKPATAAVATTPAAATDPAAKPAAADPNAKPAATTDSAPKPAAAAAPATPKPATTPGAKPTAAKPAPQATAQTTTAVPIPFPERY